MKDYQFWILIGSQVLGTIGLFLQLNNRVDQINKKIDSVKEEQSNVKVDLAILKTEFIGIKSQLSRLEKQVEFIYDQLFVPRFPKREDAA